MALHNPGMRNHAISFLTIYPSDTQVCHSSLATFYCHFILSLAGVWFPYSVFCSRQVSLFPYVHKSALSVFLWKLPHDRKTRNRPKIWCLISLFSLFNIKQVLPFSVTNNGRSSAIADRLKALVGKKNLEITKMTDHFSTKKRILKLPKLKELFFF